MVSLATGSRGMSVKQQTLLGAFKLDSEQSRPVLPLESHFRVKTCRIIVLRESKLLSRYGAW